MRGILAHGGTVLAGFFRTHAPESMARALAAWFALAAVGYAVFSKDAVITGIFCAQSAACLGLRSKPPREKPEVSAVPND